ncbi:MAG: patatin-like phospholipase family protein [Beijerinckiaceae bacterium]
MLFESVARRAFGLGGGSGRIEEPVFTPPPSPVPRRPRIGLALGSGAARGWAHIGVLQVLAERGIAVDVIAGTSMGAVAGGCFAAGKLDAMEAFARSLTRSRVLQLLDFHLYGAGLISGRRIRRRLEDAIGETSINDLPIKFAAIATEIASGHEIWLTHGGLVEALRASYALPGVFDPVQIGERWLMDGALVNPIPVTAARALGANFVIAVNLNGDSLGRGTVIQRHGQPPAVPEEPAAQDTGADIVPVPVERSFRQQLVSAAMSLYPGRRSGKATPTVGPRLAGVMVDAFNITQDRIARSRLAGDPPDLMIQPRTGKIGLFEFHRASEAIAAGREAAELAINELNRMVGHAVPQAVDQSG